MFRDLFPILSTPGLPRAMRFYRDLLGAKVTYEFPGPDGEPGYVALDLAGSHLGLGRVPGDQPPTQRTITLWVYTDDCDAAIQRLRAAGVPVLKEPADQPWGERVARVADPDGNELIVGQAAA
jgi:lactoylglutathione lyase